MLPRDPGRIDFSPSKLVFRPLGESDIETMFRWLTDPYLAGIWFQGRIPTYNDLEMKYLPRIAGKEPTRCFLILHRSEPIGFIQSYLWKDYPEDAGYLLPEERQASSLDIFIGESAYRGHGFGPRILIKFLREVIFREYSSRECLVTPLENNLIAIRAYEKTGFRKVRSFEHPKEPVPVLVMSIRKEQVG